MKLKKIKYWLGWRKNYIIFYISIIINLLLILRISIMSSTLSSFVFSLVAGTFVLIGIAVAVIWVSSNDPLTRA